MIRRGYSPNEGMMVTAIQSAKAEIPSEWFGEYYPTQEAIALNIQRMKDNGTR
jgi:Lhr-like helicase